MHHKNIHITITTTLKGNLVLYLHEIIVIQPQSQFIMDN